jgi:hypothetical protein
MSGDERVELRVSTEEREQWEYYAEQSLMTLSQWIRVKLNATIKRGGRAWTLEQQKLIDAGYRPVYTDSGRLQAWAQPP